MLALNDGLLKTMQGVTLAGTVRVERLFEGLGVRCNVSDDYGDEKAACDGGEMVEEVFARVWVRYVSEHRAWPGCRRGCEPGLAEAFREPTCLGREKLPSIPKRLLSGLVPRSVRPTKAGMNSE